MIESVLTIGAYGFRRDSFLAALSAEGVDLLVDVRARRGVRGPVYAFANAKHLQSALAEAGIRYVHVRDLAPSRAARETQKLADETSGVTKRLRKTLSGAFVRAYWEECLSRFDSRGFVDTWLKEAKRPVLFCVECQPSACHRSLLAQRLSDDLGLPAMHLVP